MVVPVSAQEAQDVVEARGVIEEWASRRMWPHRKEVLGDLAGLLDVMRAARKANAVEDFVAADRTFHERIVSAAGNEILTRQYRSLRERQLCISHVVMRVPDARMERAITSHRHLLELLATGTKADFLAATHDHLDLAHQQAGSLR
jgi:DNA-binding GntR family transcriptional regulator